MSLPPRFEWRVGLTPQNQAAMLMLAQARAMRLHIVYHRMNNEISTLGHDTKYGEREKPLTWRDRITIVAVYPGSKVQVRVKRSKGRTVTLNAQQIMEAYEWQHEDAATHARRAASTSSAP